MARSSGRDVDADVHEVVPGAEIGISGVLGVQSVADVRISLGRAIDTGSGDLVLHLGDAEVGDATGLGVIVGAHHRARRAGRRLVIADASPRLERLLRATKLNRVIAGSHQDAAANPIIA
ncbi:STAS domain-containing protein [Luteipulveratus sp. YIM 133132]|uniref:STAS domain-containing protein n=1 Tax=Luteipulveratus flavus TaxID=3031728 RepID=A0ABT6C882_9MICO|nr:MULTISPECIES: STAS domain-containing protein [unclassified Luteipulveratus]MDE9365953.1 STAS domain-containing protein [Luteipulveratus sp. YIM 133132]MDF8265143.1 STAS domain-containing protein [Luteipulveratus sp. YIM 133296]